MKTLIFDQFEFDWQSEITLEISISRRADSPHPTVAAFVEAVMGLETGAAKLPPPQMFSTLWTFTQDADYLRRLGGIAVPEDCEWPCFIMNNEWDDRFLILDQVNTFISYHWWTTA